MYNHWISLASIYGAAAVVLGAFGAHALDGHLSPAQLSSWETAVQYHLLHAVVLLALGLTYGRHDRRAALSAWSFSLGILLFSGSIYGLVLTEWRWLGPVTPIGGVCLIVGWVALTRLGRLPNPPTAGEPA